MRVVPFENTHLRPRHWQRGVLAFHEERRRLSVFPCNVGLILYRRSSTSVGEEDETTLEEDDDDELKQSSEKQRKKKKGL